MAQIPTTDPGPATATTLAPADPPPMSPQDVVAGRYRMVQQIGVGGMGEVWRAHHLALDRPVAIKLLRRAVGATSQAKQRFLREAQLTASVASRHAVQVHDFGVTDEGMPYLVMELLRGLTLRERLDAEGRLGVEEALAILRQVARSLERSHAGGVVHCDLKPDNVVLGADEDGGLLVKVLDFGIARMLGELVPAAAERTSIPAGGDPRKTLTRFGDVMGTPGYMAPEQFFATDEVGPATDVYAFGVVAYECLTGRLPFEDTRCTRAALMARAARPAQLESPRMSQLFASWFDTATEPRGADRFAEIGEALCALEIVLGRDDPAATTRPAPPAAPVAAPQHVPAPSTRDRRALLGASALAVAAALGGGLLFAPSGPVASTSSVAGFLLSQAREVAVVATVATSPVTAEPASPAPPRAEPVEPRKRASAPSASRREDDRRPASSTAEVASASPPHPPPSPTRGGPTRTAMELPSLGF